MDEVRIWVLVAVVTAMSAILGFMMKVVTNEVIKKLDDIVQELKQLSKTTTVQEQKIKYLEEQDAILKARLDDHAHRLRRLEKTKSPLAEQS